MYTSCSVSVCSNSCYKLAENLFHNDVARIATKMFVLTYFMAMFYVLSNFLVNLTAAAKFDFSFFFVVIKCVMD